MKTKSPHHVPGTLDMGMATEDRRMMHKTRFFRSVFYGWALACIIVSIIAGMGTVLGSEVMFWIGVAGILLSLLFCVFLWSRAALIECTRRRDKDA
ncbi:TPA: hypothetical protein ACYZ5L_003996 [Escherichia coli]|nr:hypothetical protein [Salmonella enterica]EKD5436168.1 hypothetical protein [Salmonella enterica subsp. enterica serovar Montevideo]